MKECLVVDESEIVCKVAARILFHLGFTTTTAGTGEAALEAFEAEERPDLVIIAANLPDMPGDQLAATLRMKPGAQSLTILGSLVESNLGTMTRFKRAGADGFIYKPFDRAALEEWLAPYRGEAA